MLVVMTTVVSGPTSGVWSAAPGWNFIPVTPTYSPGGRNHAADQRSLCSLIGLSGSDYIFQELFCLSGRLSNQPHKRLFICSNE